MKKKVFACLLVFTLLAALFLLFTGCPNFMQGNDVKNVISAEVAEANAPEISVRIQPLSSEMGTTTPNGVIKQKVGIPFTVSTAANSEYAFIGWDSPSESVSFDDIEAVETDVVTSQAQDEEILIVSNFDARPRVLTHEPFSQDGVLRNQPIKILFSEPVDPSSINYENITVVGKPRTSTDEPVSVVNLLKAPQVTGSNVVLELKSGQEFNAKNHIIVTLAKAIKDLNGHEMSNEFSWAFITGSSSDLSNPAINEIKIKINVNGVEQEEIYTGSSSAILITESDTLTVTVDASDDVSAETLYIYEAGLTDGNGALLDPADNRDLWQEDYYGKNFEYSFTFASNGYDGLKRLRFVALDGPQKTSDPVDILISVDTTAPTLSGFVLNDGKQYSAGISVPLDINVADPGNPGTDETVGSGMAYYAVTADTTTISTWTEGTPAPATLNLSALSEGSHAVYFHVKDGVGNTSYTGPQSLWIDKTAPQISGFTLNLMDPAYYYRAPANVSVTASASDPNGADASGIDNYAFTDSSSPPDAGSAYWQTYSGSFPTTIDLSGLGQGDHDIYFHVRDEAGNTAVSSLVQIHVDETPPTESFTSVTENASDITLTIAITEAAATGSGIDTLTYWEGTGSRPNPADGTGPWYVAISPAVKGSAVFTDVTLSNIYQETFTYVVVDAADNESTGRTVTYSGGSYSGSLTGGSDSGERRRVISSSSEDKTTASGYYGASGFTGYQSITSLDTRYETEKQSGFEAKSLPLQNERSDNRWENALSVRDKAFNDTEASENKSTATSAGGLEQPDFASFIVTGEPAYAARTGPMDSAGTAVGV